MELKKIVFITHPLFLGSNSMPRYASWLAEGMEIKGYEVQIVRPEAKFYKLPAPASLKKWLGYIDQYLIFPIRLKKLVNALPGNTLYVLTDHALGPYAPVIKDRKHIVHCHDFLAQRSALNEIPENPTSLSGKLYQHFIKRGYLQAKNFICISKKTQEDLLRFMRPSIPGYTTVVYNALNQPFYLLDKAACRKVIGNYINTDVPNGYVLHVGGNQWYKNRVGVIKIYNSLRDQGYVLPLVLLGTPPSAKLTEEFNKSKYKGDIHFIINAPNHLLNEAYSGADVFVFPSLAEGFGWPIIEAMASGTVVATTDEAPMNEVAGNASCLLERCPENNEVTLCWAAKSAEKILALLASEAKREEYVALGLQNVIRFDSSATLDKIEEIYKYIVAS
ncbi:glycosyltransferase family 4 protein [Flavobacterium sp. RNTU_13]|uniref:glycosyltransferase family 4 protein n=1 Tax=Flavobacterium sp. RNTU_13 TaxID=3375145 RepID=UPI003986C4DD